jgi:hypothetical protein
MPERLATHRSSALADTSCPLTPGNIFNPDVTTTQVDPFWALRSSCEAPKHTSTQEPKHRHRQCLVNVGAVPPQRAENAR